MKMTIGNTRIEFRTDFCSADNQAEIDEARLKRIAQQAQTALEAAERSGKAAS